MTRRRIALIVVTPVLLVSCVAIYRVVARLVRDPFGPLYAENCAVCHGESFEGAAQGTPLVGRALVHGDSVDEIARSISEGFPATGMPAWSKVLDESQIRGLAILISENRTQLGRTEFKTDMPLVIPDGVIESERHAFRIESVASGLHPLPFSIAPLPDGRLLLTEKVRGLSIVSPDGKQSPLIEGTPPAHDDGFEFASLVYGRGWMLDVALHPDYANNGWIYLHFGDRCRDCDTSMNKLVRGRIRDGRWVDEETIWSAAPGTYTDTPDMGAGGRISFDGNGHVFLSVGIKGASDHDGVQDLSLPYGKIHRVHDDGRIPADNPFVSTPGALPSIWSYGHRSPQGLEFDPRTGRLWGTEMGPRGGDEFNLLRPGKNYGWPLTSKGVNYDGTPVAWGKELGITFDLADIEQPVVDLTPSPAVSSFVLYRGGAFPGWQNDALVGTLKATELYRFVIEGERVVHRETLLQDLARIRDVEVGPDGFVYLLLEHATGGRIVRLVPAEGGS
jgi:glucose/arabinose dehydrogenase